MVVPQPEVTLKLIVTVPTTTPVTIPEPIIVASEVLLLLHMPPLTVSVRVMCPPVHTVDNPLMVPDGVVAPTVTPTVATAVPHDVVTV